MRRSALLTLLPLLALQLPAFDDYRCSEVCLHEENQPIKNTDSLDDALSHGHFHAHIRVAHISQKEDAVDSKTTYGTTVGGELQYQTANFYNFSATISAYISQKIAPLSGDFHQDKLNTDFFNQNGESIAYLGESYLEYQKEKLNIRLGRQQLDTPFNDRDDIRMLPNTFSALTVGYGGIEHFVFMAGYVNAWAGFDSGEDISKFKDFPGENSNGKGAWILGVQNDSFDNLELQGWYYSVDKLANILYFDANYETQYNNLNTVTGVQFAHYTEQGSSTIDGDIVGLNAEIAFSRLHLGVAYNNVNTPKRKKLIIGYGGGPYFTSMEEMTIDGINNAKAYRFFAQVSLQPVAEDLTLLYAYGYFSGNDGSDNSLKVVNDENDLVLTYPLNEKLDFELSYANIRDKQQNNNNNTGYKRVLARLNYFF
ncbi:MAG: outer membrane porin, OprD family [Epsilonproteobacteria bacterium]|nr:outer membrane porin, OprD family [Campylobacterota bacterium]